jgi:N-acetylglutamate synthase-like GNAT family acetyltransferase/DNA-binding transcriptional ArsR family regulator
MIYDILSQEGYLFLGSRLKRISDNLLSDAAKIVHSEGFLNLYPSHMAIIGVLSRGESIAISQLAQNLGLTQPSITRSVNTLRKLNIIEITYAPKDSRKKLLSLSENGIEIAHKLRVEIWHYIELVIQEIVGHGQTDLLKNLDIIEAALTKKSLYERYESLKNKMASQSEIEIIEFDEKYAADFYNINAEWIEDLFTLEEIDKEVLKNPKGKILDNGGVILLARHVDLGIIGTCALMNMGDDLFELTKMGILKKARGLKIGEALLQATIKRANEMQIQKLFLLTNKLAQAAIHLYEKLGFVHSQEIMDIYGHEYERCNVAMEYVG